MFLFKTLLFLFWGLSPAFSPALKGLTPVETFSDYSDTVYVAFSILAMNLIQVLIFIFGIQRNLVIHIRVHDKMRPMGFILALALLNTNIAFLSLKTKLNFFSAPEVKHSHVCFSGMSLS